MIPERMKEKDKFVESSFANRAQHTDYSEHSDYRSFVIAKTINTM